MAKIKFDPNYLYFWMIKKFLDNRHALDSTLADEDNPDGKPKRITFYNLGGTRAGKTFDEIHLIWKLCDSNRGKGLTIAIYRETLSDCKKNTLLDFKECFKLMNFTDFELIGELQNPVIRIFGNTIEFRGFPEEGKEGGRVDIAFFNEIFEIQSEKIFDNICQRVEKMVICDANPRLSYHWSMNRQKDFNTFYSRTTFLDNPKLSLSLQADYESKCPYDFRDSHIEYEDGFAQFKGFKRRVWNKEKCPDNYIDLPYPNNKYRAPNPNNSVEKNESLKWWWEVYGEGLPAAQSGAIFKDVKWVSEFGSGYDEVVFGVDFGYTSDNTTLSRVGRNGNETTIECMACQPTNTPEITFDLFKPQLLKEIARRKAEGDNNESIWICCESQDRYGTEVWVDSLNQLANHHGYNWNFFKIQKKSILAGVSIMKKFKINIVESDQPHIRERFRQEQQNYMYRVINDVSTNEPDPASKFCDIWDGVRYAYQHFFYWANDGQK